MIGSLMDKMISSGIKTSKTLIQNNMTQEISANNKALANIEKAIKHAAKAKKGGFWSKALGWAGVVAGAIVSVALMTNPVTFAAGAFLMASTIVGATTMAVSSTKAGQEFMKKNPWFATTMMVLQITLAVCSLGAGIYGAVSAASTEAATTAATTAAEESAETTATTVAEESAETTATTAAESGQSTVLEGLRTSASQWQTYATLAQAGIQAGKGGTDIYVGVQDGEAG
ncbi:MAG: hypothetical protein KDJ99_07375, partial [Candidatus Competibacteraceae bacterium]|nr:hypothetical protein [Candidatus Competibacteraceae bacterium]